MSPRSPRINAVELLRALKRDGWEQVRQSGSHVTLQMTYGTCFEPRARRVEV